MANLEKMERIKKANEFVRTIASHGHRFFQYNNQFAHFELNSNGQLIWNSEKNVKIHVRKGEWTKFEHGQTLEYFVRRMADYIRTEKQITDNYFSNWGFKDQQSFIVAKGIEFNIIED